MTNTIRLNKHELAEALGVGEKQARTIAAEQGWNSHQENPNSPTQWDIPYTYFTERGLPVPTGGSRVEVVDGSRMEMPGGNLHAGWKRLGAQEEKTSIDDLAMGGSRVEVTPTGVIGWHDFSQMTLSDLYCLYITTRQDNTKLSAQNEAAKFTEKSQKDQIDILKSQVDLLKTIINDKAQQLERLEPLADKLIAAEVLRKPVDRFSDNKSALKAMLRTVIKTSQERNTDYLAQGYALFHLSTQMPGEQFLPFAAMEFDGLVTFIDACKDAGYLVNFDRTDAAEIFIRKVIASSASVVNIERARG
jgi:hypothetical protein